MAQNPLFPRPCSAQIKQVANLIWQTEGCGVAEITTWFPARIRRQGIEATVALNSVGQFRQPKMAVISIGRRAKPPETETHSISPSSDNKSGVRGKTCLSWEGRRNSYDKLVITSRVRRRECFPIEQDR